ncbi:hypothetical protein RD149_13285 [Gordonia westfalica]|uniref:Uncharacterized protein n=1 Tax=Gordonia westfalica TaxID=158898 RepID=A0ABU2GTF6_9ACTN|nr:hypothetical protein [Gordonia westfalica]MDS1114742.1 hypothetical protein [Gordonia westfalica]
MTLDDLRRWEDSGAGWRVIHRGPEGATVSLLRCDGGEEVDRFVTDDPEILAHIGVRVSSEQPAR